MEEKRRVFINAEKSKITQISGIESEAAEAQRKAGETTAPQKGAFEHKGPAVRMMKTVTAPPRSDGPLERVPLGLLSQRRLLGHQAAQRLPEVTPKAEAGLGPELVIISSLVPSGSTHCSRLLKDSPP